MDIRKTQLWVWLRGTDEALADRVLHIRDELTKWLPHITQFFPHYPSHGADHSDRIVEQLSRLLFNKSKPVVNFSAAEVYCLLCAAYLHDIGMVVSPKDASEILGSEQWKAFVASDGPGHKMFRGYEAIRDEPGPGSRERLAFFGNQALRRVIAEFVRRDHHARAKFVLEMHPFLRQLVDFGDSVAFETIADIGVAHGLSSNELDNRRRFPEERDVLGGKVNVRFLARLLRIGDLLDMSTKRAAPMTERAVGPLPRDAKPHWQQYSCKKHENVTPRVIEYAFECMEQDAHRVLSDWFGWLEDEVRAAGLEQLHAGRHRRWKPPRCVVGEGEGATIVIRPAAGAKYVFRDWKLELDQERVLQRLIHDVYDDPAVFLRELIQNALDATRCQMYADFALQHPNQPLPDRPTQFPAEFRSAYPIHISFGHEEISPLPDAPVERRPVVTIEDRGTGMSDDIIRRYFLQVGRSYYRSSEFRERFKFAPTSRFGLGFLSVFAVSTDITVETARRDNATGVIGGLRLRLREPRSYLLTEPCDTFKASSGGAKTGTRIRVVLDPSRRFPIRDAVERWCVAAEVPIVVKDDEGGTTIQAARLCDGQVLAEGLAGPGTEFILRVFDIDGPDVEGQVAVVVYTDERGEAWCDCWPDIGSLAGQPARLHHWASFTAFHGIWLGDAPVREETRGPPDMESPQWLQRCDVRCNAATVPMARAVTIEWGVFRDRLRERPRDGTQALDIAASAVESTAQRAVARHLQSSPRASGAPGINYAGDVLSAAPVSNGWRMGFPRTVLTWQAGQPVGISGEELLSLTDVVVAGWDVQRFGLPWRQQIRRYPREVLWPRPIISLSDVPDFCREPFFRWIANMQLAELSVIDNLWLLRFAADENGCGCHKAPESRCVWFAPSIVGGLAAVSLSLDGTCVHGSLRVLNREHALVRWLQLLRERACDEAPAINKDEARSMWRTATAYEYDMDRCVKRWAESPTVPESLKPPRNENGEPLRFGFTSLVSVRTVTPRAGSRQS